MTSSLNLPAWNSTRNDDSISHSPNSILLPLQNKPISPVDGINAVSVNIHLNPGRNENAPFAGHLSCAPSEGKESREKAVAGCDRPCPLNS